MICRQGAEEMAVLALAFVIGVLDRKVSKIAFSGVAAIPKRSHR